MRVSSAPVVSPKPRITRQLVGVALLSAAILSLLGAVQGLPGVARQIAHLKAPGRRRTRAGVG